MKLLPRGNNLEYVMILRARSPPEKNDRLTGK